MIIVLRENRIVKKKAVEEREHQVEQEERKPEEDEMKVSGKQRSVRVRV